MVSRQRASGVIHCRILGFHAAAKEILAAAAACADVDV
jgi:hypothetical protein